MQKDFLIENIDPLGQGVSKTNNEILFVKKTLPGEAGIAEITSQKKGVSFGVLSKLNTKSEHRINSTCPHFELCNGCDFLHTSYEQEVNFKKINIERSLKYLGCEQFHFHPAPKRMGYRNRIQLHYNKKLKKLGFIDIKNRVVEVPNCSIAQPKILERLKELYANQSWLGFVTNEKLEGHIELYEKKGKVEIAVNEEYAQGGFTQVNEEMNQKLNTFLTNYINQKIDASKIIFDLFGGNGNLTKQIKNPTLVVDHYPQLPENTFHQSFLHQNLYSDKAITNIKKQYSKNPHFIIFDPPRSGVKNLGDFLAAFKPEGFIFIACEFSSFNRDIKAALVDYQLTEVHIFDLFPSTHHFETIGIFTKRS